MTDSAERFAHWSRYWEGGPLTSLPDDFRENYDGELAAFWFDRFAGLPQPAEILDVCTGNGAVALLAVRWARENRRDIAVTAIDAARIDPESIARRWPAQAALLPLIKFRPESPLETLALEAESVDLICSQYGLEYCELDKAVPRLAVALRPGGELVMLAHDLSTAMVSTMQSEQSEYELLQSLGFERLLKRWAAGLLDAQSIRKGLEETAKALAGQPATGAGPLIGQVIQSCRALLGMPAGQLLAQKSQAAAYLAQIDAGRLRIEDMLRVNRQIGLDDQWLDIFEQAGLQLIETLPVKYQGVHHVGTARRWKKSQGA